MAKAVFVLLSLTAASLSAAAVVGKGKAFLGNGMQPAVVARTLSSVEDEWKAQAAVFAECNSTSGLPGSALVNCADAPSSFGKSCGTVVSAIVQGSGGDRAVAKEYMADVCSQGIMTGWHQLQCHSLAKSVQGAMTADKYSNRLNFNTGKLCISFWASFLAEEQQRLATEKAEREAAEQKAAEEEKAEREAAEKKAAEEAAKEAERKKKEEAEREKKEAEAKAAEAKAKAAEAAARVAQKKAEAAAVAEAAKQKMAEAEAAERENKKAAVAANATEAKVPEAELVKPEANVSTVVAKLPPAKAAPVASVVKSSVPAKAAPVESAAVVATDAQNQTKAVAVKPAKVDAANTSTVAVNKTQ